MVNIPKKKKTFFILLFFFFIVIFSIYIIFSNLQDSSKLSTKFKTWGIHMDDIENFTINETNQIFISNIQVEDVIAQDYSKIIKIRRFTNVDTRISERYAQDRFLQLNSLFISTPSPYFGVLTQRIECPEEFKPKINKTETFDKIELTYYILYASDRFTYGVCSKDLIKYKTLFSFVYCSDKKNLYQVEVFSSPNEPDSSLIKIISSFRCHL